MTTTAVAIIPQNLQLPAHLQTPEMVAAIAAANAAAAGGIKAGGFPRISIKGGKFHIVKGGETATLLQPAQPGQPQLPLMCLEVVIVASNPQLSKKLYLGDYTPGDDKEPDCSSDNGIAPDTHIAAPQHSNCAQCKQNQWGSKISKSSGKEVKACSDEKRLAVLPGDLTGEAMGFTITPSALGDWGKYVRALTDRGISVNAIVTNLTFDPTASHPKVLFSFNRFLGAEEFVKAQSRAADDDVKAIVQPVRQVALPPPPPAVATPTTQVSAPTTQVSAPTTVVATGFGNTAVPAQEVAPVAPLAPAPVTQPAAPSSVPAGVAPQVSGTATVATVESVPPAGAAPVAEEKKTRKPRAKKEESEVDLTHLPPEIAAAVKTLGVTSEVGKQLLAQYPKPAAVAATTVAVAPPQAVSPPVAAVPAAAVPSGFGQTGAAPAAPAGALDLKQQLLNRLSAGQKAATTAPQ